MPDSYLSPVSAAADSGLTAEQLDLLPSAEHIDFFHRHGYWISPQILPDALLDAAERGMARFYEGDLDAPLPGAEPGTRPVYGAGLRKHDYASLAVRELAELVRYPMIAATAALLSGADGIRLWHDQLLFKPADAPDAPGNVGWHTDRQYWQSCSSEEMLTAWVGFHDVDETGGSVSFMDGSNRWDVSGLDFFSQDMSSLESAIAGQGHPLSVRPTTMRRGQVSFHHSRTVHGSKPNHRSTPRRSLAIHLQPADNRWQFLLGPDGRPAWHLNDGLVRRTPAGVPDYADPDICPSLWPSADTAAGA
jgi:ectoine hydroxylase-related dioxygenase (phytanoyl-CoA dioxygenase family)